MNHSMFESNLESINKNNNKIQKDNINHPSHYAEGRDFEPIDVINDWDLNFNLGNTVKYISRVNRKQNSIEDLEKAKFYLEYELNRLRSLADNNKND